MYKTVSSLALMLCEKEPLELKKLPGSSITAVSVFFES
jgi:hypothetical protein